MNKKKKDNMKELLFEKSFLQFFSEELIRNKLDLLPRSNRFNDGVDKDGIRYEIKGTVVRDKGKNYRPNKSTYSKKQIERFIADNNYLLATSRKLCSFERSSLVRFVSIFNKIEFSKFDIFVGVIYFDDVVKIISYSREELEKNSKISKQFRDGVFSLSLDRNNIKKIINDNLLFSLTYDEIFS